MVDRELVASPGDDPEHIAQRLIRMKNGLRSVMIWPVDLTIRVSLWSQKLGEAYRARGFRTVRMVAEASSLAGVTYRQVHDTLADLFA